MVRLGFQDWKGAVKLSQAAAISNFFCGWDQHRDDFDEDAPKFFPHQGTLALAAAKHAPSVAIGGVGA